MGHRAAYKTLICDLLKLKRCAGWALVYFPVRLGKLSTDGLTQISTSPPHFH